MSTSAPLRELTLEDRYTAESGPILLDGMQALVRMMLDLRRLDARRGHDTGVFVSGYPGSPLGGLDLELERAPPHLEPAGIVFRPGLNEELAATAVAGTQLLGELPDATKQGVTGFWYGKAPDSTAPRTRSATATSRHRPAGRCRRADRGRPGSKSSTVPSAQRADMPQPWMPVLAPGDDRRILSWGLHAVEISGMRDSGQR